MFGSGVLDIAISVVFIYLLLSLICSTINEWVITRFFALRAKTLEAGIQTLLGDPSGKGLAKAFYAHPLITVLAQQGKVDNLRQRKSTPSYIPAHTFSLALLDLLAQDNSSAPKQLADIRAVIAQPSNTILKTLLSNSRLQHTILLLLDSAGGDIAKAHSLIEQWFNDTMDRVSGWYKRKVQLIIIGLALVITVLLNIDSLMLIRELSRDTVMRASIVAGAQNVIQKPLPAGTDLRQIQTNFQQLRPLTGWSREAGDPRAMPTTLFGWLAKLGGCLCTTIAISLGAPFWFDILNKFMSFRSAGKPPTPPDSSHPA